MQKYQKLPTLVGLSDLTSHLIYDFSCDLPLPEIIRTGNLVNAKENILMCMPVSDQFLNPLNANESQSKKKEKIMVDHFYHGNTIISSLISLILNLSSTRNLTCLLRLYKKSTVQDPRERDKKIEKEKKRKC
uniref:Kinesin family member 3A n=1 Tax=Sus scrofa TaxID=9823 RepID=A0A8D1XX44_PIG